MPVMPAWFIRGSCILSFFLPFFPLSSAQLSSPINKKNNKNTLPWIVACPLGRYRQAKHGLSSSHLDDLHLHLSLSLSLSLCLVPP